MKKVWIGIDTKPLEKSDYEVISPLEGLSPFNLDEYLDDGECQEIVIENILEHVPIQSLNAYLVTVSKKLAHGGKITIYGIDLLQVVKEYYDGNLDILGINNILFGNKTNAWDFKLGCVTLFEVSEILKKLGLKIIHKRLPHLTYSITAERQ